MNKNELIDAVAAEAGTTKAESGRVLDAFINQITTAVASGDKVTLVGFGTFQSAKRAAKTGRNPKTGAMLEIPATVTPKFSAGATFKARVKAGK